MEDSAKNLHRKNFDTAEVMSQISNELRKARREAMMTQDELSTKAGLCEMTIAKIERGKGQPSIVTLQRIASALGKKITIQFA